jgi:hypothetical protein
VVKSKTSKEDVIEGVGKSFDCTNASVQNNDNEQNISDKEMNVIEEKPKEVVEVPRLQFDDLNDDDFLKHDPLLDEVESFHSHQFMSRPLKEKEHIKAIDSHYINQEGKNLDFEMDLSESLDFDHQKEAAVEAFDNSRYNLHQLQIEEPNMEEESDYLGDGFI